MNLPSIPVFNLFTHMAVAPATAAGTTIKLTTGIELATITAAPKPNASSLCFFKCVLTCEKYILWFYIG